MEEHALHHITLNSTTTQGAPCGGRRDSEGGAAGGALPARSARLLVGRRSAGRRGRTPSAAAVARGRWCSLGEGLR